MEAYDKFRTHPNEFDLVIADQTMPQMTGQELLNEVYDIRPELPVILLPVSAKQSQIETSAKWDLAAI